MTSVNQRWYLAFGLLLALSFNGWAAQIRLITIGPGDAFWSAFGHTAIAVDDEVYGFGYFSFSEDLVAEFISNTMQYDLGVSEINWEARLAADQNRDFSIIELQLNGQQEQQLVEFLTNHYRPENRTYTYDYFLNNCSTKIRDILDDITNNYLSSKEASTLNSSYYAQTFPAKGQGLMNLGLAVGYGWGAYQPRSTWELMAFPVFLESAVIEKLSDISQPRQLVFAAADVGGGWLATHWALVLYSGIFILALWPSFSRKLATKVWFYWHAVVGLILLALWLFTPHAVADWNVNVLFFMPLGFMLFSVKAMQWIVLGCWLLWVGLLVYLKAWYLLPLLLPGLLAMRNLVVIEAEK